MNCEEKKLVEFCESGDLKSLQDLTLDFHSNIHLKNELEFAFIQACKYGHLNIVKYLGSLRVDIYGNRNRAFKVACQNGHLNIVKYLIDFDIDIYDTDAWDNDALELACKNCHLNIVKYLIDLDLKGDRNFRGFRGFSFEGCLRWACEYGHLNIAKYLVNIGHNVYTNIYAFREACMNGHLNMVKYLIDIEFDLDGHYDDNNGYKWASRLAQDNNHLNVAQYLINRGADD